MSANQLQRFSKIEIAYHWIQAALYLALVLTGGCALFQRLFEVDLAPFEMLGWVHRIFGFILIFALSQFAILILFAEPFRILYRTTRESLNWRKPDLMWLIKASYGAVRKGYRMPDVGRFNPGQKIHLAGIIILQAGFILTGLSMIFAHGALAAWIGHVGFFLLACPLLGVHIFLSLINPETRRALGAMFHGYVSQDYAEEHHPLWADEKAPKDSDANQLEYWQAPRKKRPLVSLSVTVLTFGAVGALGFYWAEQYGAERLANRVHLLVEQSGLPAIMPQPLTAAHGEDPEASRCFACHDLFSSPQSEKCLKCHAQIQKSIDEKSGFHGFVKEECRYCHAEHKGASFDIRPLDKTFFNHALARFPLEGKHKDAECGKCHLVSPKEGSAPRMKYLGLKFEKCADCHSNPHEDERANDCLRCHSMIGFKRDQLVFDHQRDSRFPLLGKHLETVCDKCHKPPDAPLEIAKFTLWPAGTNCIDCHSDPHHGQFEKSCNECHSEEGWDLEHLADPHGRESRFPLAGKHAELECVQCHLIPEGSERLADARFAPLPLNCAECHTDPHKGGLGRDCERCHNEKGWKAQAVIEGHGPGARFPLEGKHLEIDCQECHVEKKKGSKSTPVSKPLPIECAGCHKDPHKGQFARACGECHTEDGWNGRWLVDPHGREAAFKLVGKHAQLACEKCHPKPTPKAPLAEAKFTNRPTSCEGCHEDPHRGQMSHACSACHEEQSWTGEHLLFSHARHSSFQLDPTHKGVACENCHGPAEKRLYRPVPKTCDGCHRDIVRLMEGNAPSIQGPPDPHMGRVKCIQCHDVKTYPQPSSSYATACASCHNDEYLGLYHDWSKLFNEHELELQKQERAGARNSRQLRASMREAWKIGFHNLRLAESLWQSLLTRKPAPAKNNTKR